MTDLTDTAALGRALQWLDMIETAGKLPALRRAEWVMRLYRDIVANGGEISPKMANEAINHSLGD